MRTLNNISPRATPSAKMSDPTKTLLVVDDDPMVREVEAQVLRLQIEAAPKHPGINVGFDARPGITSYWTMENSENCYD